LTRPSDIELPVLYSEHLTGIGQLVVEHAAKLNWEGIISKRAEAAYRSERTEAWLKIKIVQREKFPVFGFLKDPTGVAALYLGKRQGKELVYMGKVGTGWSRTVPSQIRKQLDRVSPKSKLTKPTKKPKATWVEPSFVADIEYRDIMSEGLLRASSFKGLSRKPSAPIMPYLVVTASRGSLPILGDGFANFPTHNQRSNRTILESSP
jgi:bifunctional non-homologous end joining protein LigD